MCKNIIRKEVVHMPNNHIRELRKNLGLSQESLAKELGTTQQAVSRMENNAYDIPSDILINMSDKYNVTTDYILGISDVKRDYNGQYRMNQEMDRCYDIVLRYQKLSEINQKTLRCILSAPVVVILSVKFHHIIIKCGFLYGLLYSCCKKSVWLFSYSTSRDRSRLLQYFFPLRFSSISFSCRFISP